MLDVVTFKWRAKGVYRSTFGPETVNVMRRMIARHYPYPHRFSCVTDDPTGIDKGVRIIPLWPDFADVPSPHGAHQPSCYRRLKLFSPDAVGIIGPRFVSIDLDTVITGDLTPIFDRAEDFVAWGETDQRSFYNGSLMLMTAGARRQVWDRFDPERSPQEAMQAGRFGSDQGWISHVLGPGEAMLGTADGVYSYRIHLKPAKRRPPHSYRRRLLPTPLPDNARVVNFHGRTDPWSPEAQQLEWVRRCWR